MWKKYPRLGKYSLTVKMLYMLLQEFVLFINILTCLYVERKIL
jgi:hypothetical protein